MNCQDHLYRNADPRLVSPPLVLRAVRRRAGCDRARPAAAGARPQATPTKPTAHNPLAPKQPHFAPKAKRVIFLFMAGAPSHLELFDYKPQLAKFDGTLPPPELIKGYRAAFINPSSKLLGPEVQVRQARQVRRGALRAAAAPGRRWSTTSPSSSRWSPTPSTTRPARS